MVRARYYGNGDLVCAPLTLHVYWLMLRKPKNRKLAAALAFAGIVSPVSGFHKFYLGQPVWGFTYLLLSWTLIPKIASTFEAVWYLLQNPDEFDHRFNGLPMSVPATPKSSQPTVDPKQVSAIADALRELDRLRQDGLMSEYEFEQKRRQLLDQIE